MRCLRRQLFFVCTIPTFATTTHTNRSKHRGHPLLDKSFQLGTLQRTRRRAAIRKHSKKSHSRRLSHAFQAYKRVHSIEDAPGKRLRYKAPTTSGNIAPDSQPKRRSRTSTRITNRDIFSEITLLTGFESHRDGRLLATVQRLAAPRSLRTLAVRRGRKNHHSIGRRGQREGRLMRRTQLDRAEIIFRAIRRKARRLRSCGATRQAGQREQKIQTQFLHHKIRFFVNSLVAAPFPGSISAPNAGIQRIHQRMQQQIVAKQTIIGTDLELVGAHGPEIDLPARGLQKELAQQIPMPGSSFRKIDQQRIVLAAAGENEPEVPADVDAIPSYPAAPQRGDLRTPIAAIRKRDAAPAGRVGTPAKKTTQALEQARNISSR